MDKRICYVMDYGWIIEGTETGREGGRISLEDAAVIRSWANGRGIGAIADPAHKNDYTLDPIGDVTLLEPRVIFEIPLGW